MIGLLIDRSISIYHQSLVYYFKVLADTVWQIWYLQLIILICDKIFKTNAIENLNYSRQDVRRIMGLCLTVVNTQSVVHGE